MRKIDGLDIRDKRERERQYATDQIGIAARHCSKCGSQIVRGQCRYGCLRAIGERFNYQHGTRWFNVLKIGEDWYQAVAINGNPFSGKSPADAIEAALRSERQYESLQDCEWAQESEAGGMWDEHIQHGQA